MIQQIQVKYSIKRLCKVFCISRSSFKAWSANPKRINSQKVKELAVVRRIYKQNNGSAGARTIAQ